MEAGRWSPSSTITATRVLCGDDWVSPAATLYYRGSHQLAVWDGTFFVLRRS